MNKQLIVIEGPTASGKTALAVELAQHFKTVVLSADSRQFYKEMAIGTAKPDSQEMKGIFHYFIDSHSVENELTAAEFAVEAEKVLTEEFEKQNVVVLVGGSGMFIDALCNGLDDIPASEAVRNELNREFELHGLNPLVEELKMKDPVFYEQVDQKNPVRVIRALEAIRISGVPYSQMRTAAKKEHSFEIKKFIIGHERNSLYERINLRVDQMMENGLLEEVKSLVPFRDSGALRTVGYTELFDFLDGKIALNTAVELIKQNSRRYAKRQLTWFRKHTDAVTIPYGDLRSMVEQVLENC